MTDLTARLDDFLIPGAVDDLGRARRIVLDPRLLLSHARSALAVALPLVLSACATLPENFPREASHAFQDTADTRLGRIVSRLSAGQAPTDSGHHMLSGGLDAFAARVVLIREADRSIDVKSHFIREGVTARFLLHELVKAADRGVRVRLLLDDFGTAGQDARLLALDGHPQFQVRVFNPFASRGSRLLGLLTDFRRLNRRMHNKSLIVDNQVAIVGGRNIADEYFSARADLDFGDLDVMSLGPVVDEVSSVFDAFWSSDWALPISAIAREAPPPEEVVKIRNRLDDAAGATDASPYADAVRDSRFMQQIRARRLELWWAPAHLAYDLPEKITAPPGERATHMGPQLRRYVDATASSLIIMSPYFVPQAEGVEVLGAIRARGVRVVVVTNSLASTDVWPVHTGYARYRRALLEAGVELWEVKPHTYFASSPGDVPSTARSALHAKVFVFDREALFVGSFNLDPRSLHLNTEMGVVLQSPELSARAYDRILEAMPEKAYRLRLGPNGGLEWVEGEGANAEIHHTEPRAGFWRGLLSSLLSFVPIESQL